MFFLGGARYVYFVAMKKRGGPGFSRDESNLLYYKGKDFNQGELTVSRERVTKL